ncbi:uncharacterized protein LOC128883538 isoform X2 [Hylaeus volcanicus]|uniref:uncharacterized protein LOC128883538 isoform X2 n=1 Tax=Hylaeus volcanicus TaxID=313075 RepID=UPI0023B7DD99|nr:uncharacterized protein LOC128883538 isoform X2 [Hylaeus volcanicus]
MSDCDLSVFSLPGRSLALLCVILSLSIVFSLFGIIFIFYPLITEEIELKIFKLPHFQLESYSKELIKAASLLGQWTLPIQLLHVIIGPIGVLLLGIIVVIISSRELGLTDNIHRRFRTENPFLFSRTIFAFIMASHALAMTGQWCVHRFSPPCCCNILGLLTNVIPLILALYLTSGVQYELHTNIVEIMTPISLICSTVGVTIVLVFVIVYLQLTECLPSDGVFQHYQIQVFRLHNYWKKLLLHPVIWINICIHSMFFSHKFFWIYSIPSAQRAFQWHDAIPTCYQKFLLFDGIGRFVIPFFTDTIFGPRCTRLDFLALLGVPVLLLSIIDGMGYVSPTMSLYWFYGMSGYLAFISAYAVSITRATVDCFFVTSVFSISESCAIIFVLFLNHGTYSLEFRYIYNLWLLSSCIGILGLFLLWEKYCDFLGDQYGYPYGQILESTQTESGSYQLLISTAMIPLWTYTS